MTIAHFQHEIFLLTRNDDDSLSFAQQISRSEFCETNWHSIKRSVETNCSSKYASKQNKIVNFVKIREIKENRQLLVKRTSKNNVFIARKNTRMFKKKIVKSFVKIRKSKENRQFEVFFLKTMIAFHFHYAHRESARMIMSLRKWSWVNDNDNQ